MMEPLSYDPFGKIGPDESMRLDENSFLDRVVDFKHKIVVVNETGRLLQFYGTAEGAHGFEDLCDHQNLKGWVKCNEVIIRIREWPMPKRPFWRRFLDLFKEAS